LQKLKINESRKDKKKEKWRNLTRRKKKKSNKQFFNRNMTIMDKRSLMIQINLQQKNSINLSKIIKKNKLRKTVNKDCSKNN
jgi:hypothetical protein